jgi:hypothetical protein
MPGLTQVFWISRLPLNRKTARSAHKGKHATSGAIA